MERKQPQVLFVRGDADFDAIQRHSPRAFQQRSVANVPLAAGCPVEIHGGSGIDPPLQGSGGALIVFVEDAQVQIAVGSHSRIRVMAGDRPPFDQERLHPGVSEQGERFRQAPLSEAPLHQLKTVLLTQPVNCWEPLRIAAAQGMVRQPAGGPLQ
jgi:hypothetical protein